MTFEINSAAPEDAVLFYSNSVKDIELGCIGHLRGDFGRGKEFWTTWWDNQCNLKTQEFKEVFNVFINTLRNQGLLKDREGMASYCFSHPEARMSGAWHNDVFGFSVHLDHYRFYIRCFPHQGDYNFYIYCYKDQTEQTQDAIDNAYKKYAHNDKNQPER